MGWGISLALIVCFLPSPKPGFPVHLDGGFAYSPAAADLNGDGSDDIVAVAGGIWAVDGHGVVMDGWPTMRGYIFNSRAAVGNAWNGDHQEIAAGRAYWLDDSIRTYLFNTWGTLLPPWPVTIGWVTIRTRLGVPSLIDMDRDDLDELIAPSSFGPHVIKGSGEIVLPHNGNPGLLGGDILTADVGGDPALELIVLTEPIRIVDLSGDVLWEFSSGLDTVFGGILADLDGDGKLEILLMGELEDRLTLNALGFDGTTVPGWPLRTGISSIFYVPCGLSAGDLDGDGLPEVILTATDIMKGIVYVARADGTPCNHGEPIFRSSGFPGEALAVNLHGGRKSSIVVQFCGSDNRVRIYAFDIHGKIEKGWPIVLAQCPCNNRSLTPAVADIDGDKRSDLVALSPNGILYAYEISEFPPQGDWLQENHDARNSFALSPRLGRRKPSAVRERPRVHLSASESVSTVKGEWSVFDATGRRMTAPIDLLPPGLYFATEKGRPALRILKVR